MMPGSRIEQLVVTVSIDTECDHDPNWVRSRPLTFESITEGLPNRLQPAFAEVGAVPTYLLTVEVLEDPDSVAALRSLSGSHEYGTHLHAAFIEPEKKFTDYAGVDSPDFQCASTAEVEYQKLANLTQLGLYQSDIRDEDLDHLTGLGTLTQLDLSYTLVTDEGLAKIAALRRLEKLFLHQLELEKIDAYGGAYAQLAEAMVHARERLVVLERR